MRLLQKYIQLQVLWPLISCLLALAVLALLTQSLQTLDLIVDNHQSAITFLYITLLTLPQLIGIILPLALFMAVLYALNRLNMDSELIVARASGITPWQIATPILRIASCALIIHLIINLALQPLAFREMRKQFLKVRTDIATQIIQPGQFVSPTPNLTLYARQTGANGSLLDVLIYDNREDGLDITHTAKYGFIKIDDNKIIIILQQGDVQQRKGPNKIDFIGFDNYQIDLSDISATDTVLRLKDADRYLHELLRPNPNEFITRKTKRERLAEGHSRLSAPLYNLALSMLALCFMISGTHMRLGYGRQIALCAIIGLGLRLSGYGLSSAANSSYALNIAQYGLPVSVIIITMIILFNPSKSMASLRRHRPPSKHLAVS